MASSVGRGLLLVLVLCLGVALSIPLAQAGPLEAEVVGALRGHARPLSSTDPGGGLRDLAPLGRMVEGAAVVGAGEATHGSSEFFTMKHRIFRYLVEEKGFTTFALETDWGIGLRLNDYVLYGRGDPARIMREEFQGGYAFWNTREQLRLIEWMRARNATHPTKVQFMGNDIGYPAPRLFDEVTGYVRRYHPEALPRLAELYRGLRPVEDQVTWTGTYPARPRAERLRLASRADRALALVRGLRDGPAPEARAWAEQHARVVAQVATLYAIDFEDPAQVAQAMRHRDRAMAENTAWWHERTGHKVLLSAHNAHVAYESYLPRRYPRMQGAFLRDRLGARYVNVGFTFHQGSFNAQDAGDGDRMRAFTVGPAPGGGNEHTLDRVPFRDFLLDLRTAPPAARIWLTGERPTRLIGTGYPEPEHLVSLRRSYDVLVHLHRVGASDLLG